VTPDALAEIVAEPAAIDLARLLLLMVATEVREEAQTAWLVRFFVLPSEYLPVAVNC
jgi:hypothetical protein